MNRLDVQISDGRAGFRPREALHGVVKWHLPQSPSAVEVRLCWYLEVQGIVEARRVETLRFERPSTEERRDFEFQ